MARTGVLVAACALLLAFAAAVGSAAGQDFVRVSGNKLVSDCGDFNVVGWNG